MLREQKAARRVSPGPARSAFKYLKSRLQSRSQFCPPPGSGVGQSQGSNPGSVWGNIGTWSGDDIARNAIMRYAIRFFLKAYVKGQVDPLKDVDTPKPKSQVPKLSSGDPAVLPEIRP